MLVALLTIAATAGAIARVAHEDGGACTLSLRTEVRIVYPPVACGRHPESVRVLRA